MVSLEGVSVLRLATHCVGFTIPFLATFLDCVWRLLATQLRQVSPYAIRGLSLAG